MTSTLTYHRLVKEVPGVYMVAVRLELPPNREARVFVGRYRDRGYQCSNYAGGSCGPRAERRCFPINPLAVQSLMAHEYEEIGNFWVNDTITIEIRDKLLEKYGGGPYQQVVYTATMDGFEVQSLPCTLHDRTWPVITFEEISVIEGGVHIPALSTQDFAKAVRKLQQRNFSYISVDEISAIVKRYVSEIGEINEKAATEAVERANKRARLEARKAIREQAVKKETTPTNPSNETTTSEPLVIRQALDIIQTHT